MNTENENRFYHLLDKYLYSQNYNEEFKLRNDFEEFENRCAEKLFNNNDNLNEILNDILHINAQEVKAFKNGDLKALKEIRFVRHELMFNDILEPENITEKKKEKEMYDLLYKYLFNQFNKEEVDENTTLNEDDLKFINKQESIAFQQGNIDALWKIRYIRCHIFYHSQHKLMFNGLPKEEKALGHQMLDAIKAKDFDLVN